MFKRIPYAPYHAVNEDGEIKRIGTGKIINGHADKDGRKTVCLFPYYEKKPVHRIVADMFLPPPKPHQVLIHKDGNNSNNKVTNLEWVDKKTYQRFLYAYGKNHGHRGVHCKPVIINETGQSFESISECARYLKVDPVSVRSQLNGKSKTCKGYTFRYK